MSQEQKQVISWKALARYIQFEPTYHQRYILEHLNTYSAIAGGKRVGKTKLAAFLALYELMQADRVIWCVAPTYGLAEKVFKEVLEWRNKYLSDILKVSVHTQEIRNLLANSILKMKSTDVPVSLKGEGLDLVIGDEVGDWKKETWERYIEPNLIQTRKHGKTGRAFLIGNANYFGSEWHKLCETKGPDRFTYNLPTAYLDINGKVKSNNPTIVSHEILQKLYDEKDSKIWRQEYLADFVASQGVVFDNITECACGKFEEPRSDRFYYIGVDLGRVQDFSVVTVIDSKTFNVVYWERFKDIDYVFQKKRILAIVRRFGSDHTKTIIDQTGLGQPIVDDLQRESINIEGFVLTNMSKKDLIENLSIMMQQRKVVYPASCTELIGELQVFSYKMSETDRIQYSAPPGYHDDCVISLALACWSLKDYNPQIGRDPEMTEQDLVKESSKFEIDGLLTKEDVRPYVRPYSIL